MFKHGGGMIEQDENIDDKPREKFVPQRTFGTAAERARRNLNAKLSNPLAGFSHSELRKQGRAFAMMHEMGDESDIRAFELGAVLAQSPERFENVAGLMPQEKEVLRHEFEHRWSQPWSMYAVIALCSLSAAVQGMDETVVNGAQIWYKHQFGIAGKEPRDTWLVGLINAAPYLCCAFVGCWLTVPFNHWFGRRGTIFITCCFSAIACLWQGFVNTWWSMFVARFALGFGIGPKSATVPIYAAETAPPAVRGALVMQWQMWTAFGIMLGYAADLIFYQVGDPAGIVGMNWRLMMASAMFPAVMVCCFVFACPESPRWYMSKKQYYRAYQSICTLRHHKIQAARDMYYMHTLLEAENSMKLGQNKLLELITVPRNRRAMLASEIVMFMQQFCGVNVIAYYSSEIFLEANFSPAAALAASFGWGVINWIFAIPAVYAIDTFGRRNLLLTTFPLMALAMFFTGFSFWIPEENHSARTGCIALGTYIFGIVYSPGEGPVPFTYSAEAYPLYVRSYGMALATATTWFFNFVLGVTWPSLRNAFTPQGAFAWYAGWCIVGWWLVLLFMPETKNKTLEELDQVFSVPTRFHAKYGLRQIPYFVKRYALRKDVRPEILYEREDTAPTQDLGFNA
ncbi:Major facilitator superfamily domain general substrate transporter [Penicillium argentinense]|uniref:Major facilitator superfamily domain general substrate transporter n=1 Tax=Penicillium argentinense TaxID=1131581 RepID=A0A9W9F7Q0_9EURO|nr:Major facilitator superfamily domain general substrate transporter [Penicillium argentinense]KAJ5095032.1 Major facilitator superfamily domain general substrate transporter [Penicillium argentinense]